jgi:hypothetical protein
MDLSDHANKSLICKMTSIVLPFPLRRRRAFVRRHAAIMASLNVAAAERHLVSQLRIQAATLIRKGIATALVDREVMFLGNAIRAELLRLASARGGAA